MLRKRLSLALLVSVVWFSCKTDKTDIQGFWVGFSDNENVTILDIRDDSIIIFYPHGFSLKSKYILENDTVKGKNLYHLFTNDFYYDEAKVGVEVRNDTLFWNTEPQEKFVRSQHDSFVIHYANSKGLKIELPDSPIFIPSNFNRNNYVDFFIGYRENGDVGIILNNELLGHFDLLERMQNLKDSIHRKSTVVRVFADKTIDVSMIHFVHNLMKQTGIVKIHYVTTDTYRTMKNYSHNPYSRHFNGIKILVRDINLVVKPDSVDVSKPEGS
ncbi:MAG: hypothetical protein JXR03_10620 [Cyclobacteriaceae bacterium]